MDIATVDLTTFDNDEPRILDVTLGERLGMAQPLNLRSTIVAHRVHLEEFGSFHAVRENPTSAGGRPSTAYYLNEEQALYICALSRTEAGHRVRSLLIKTFSAVRRGDLVPVSLRTSAKPSLPDFTNPVEAAATIDG